jgi:hypothetical protein
MMAPSRSIDRERQQELFVPLLRTPQDGPVQIGSGSGVHNWGTSMQDDERRFALLLGIAALSVWGDMPRDIQEALFEHAMKGNDADRESFARLLHSRHPRTLHPPRPD